MAFRKRADLIGLPQTGRTVAGVDGDDAYYQAGYAPAERFTDNGDGTITDNATGLMWVKDMRLGTPKGWWVLNTEYSVGDIVCGPATGYNYVTGSIAQWDSGTNYYAGISAAWMDVNSPVNSDEGWTGNARYFWRALQSSGPANGGAVNPSTDTTGKWGLAKAYRCIVAHTGSAPGGDPFGGERWVRVPHIGAMKSSEEEFHERPVCWPLAIQFCNDFEFAGYSNWRLANVHEALSICNWEAEAGGYGAICSEFTNQAENVSYGWTWTSTKGYSDVMAVYRTIDPRPYPKTSTEVRYLRPCRGGHINV